MGLLLLAMFAAAFSLLAKRLSTTEIAEIESPGDVIGDS